MSGANDKRDYSLTVRFSDAEREGLERLAERFNLDRSATVRHALQMALNDQHSALPKKGQFVPTDGSDVTFPIRLSRKASDD